MKFYHLTTSKLLPIILEKGLDPNFSKSSLQAVFLSNCIHVAEEYLCMKEEDCVLLEIELNPEQYDFGPDNYELADILNDMSEEELEHHDLWDGATWNDCTWEQSLKICNQIACYSIISPNDIKVLKTIKTT